MQETLTHTLRWPLALALCISLAACSDPDSPPDTDMQPGADMPATDMPPDTDTSPDAAPDADMGPIGPMADVIEVEPNNIVDPETNQDQSTPFMAGQSIGGTIAPGGGNQDVDEDIFSVQLQAGQVFEWEISELGAGFSNNGILLVLQDAEKEFVRILGGGQGSSRQAFIPETGKYYLAIFDSRATSNSPPAHGGPNATYVIKTSAKQLEPTAATFPGQQSGDWSDAKTKAYSFTWSSPDLMRAEIFAERPPGNSDLDSVLYLWDNAAGRVIAFNDDIDAENDNYDSIIVSDPQSGSAYTLIVDGYRNVSQGNFSLVVTATDDSPDFPTTLPIGGSAEGVISEGNAQTDTIDEDYFLLTVPSKQTVKVTVRATGDDAPLQPLAYVPGFFGPQAIAVGVEGSAAMTLHNSGDSPRQFLIVLNDARNLPLEQGVDPTYVGGASFTYTINAEAIMWTPVAAELPITDPAELPLGEYVWYDVTLPEHSILSLGATTEFMGNRLVLAYRLASGAVAIADPGSLYVSRAGRSLTVGVVDERFQGSNGATSYTFTPAISLAADLSMTQFVEASDNGANNTPATAQAIDLPSLVTGEVTRAGDAIRADHYVVTLTQGQRFVVYTEIDPANANSAADTTLAILNAAGMKLAENDDAEGDQDFFSAILFEAPEDGDYTIVVGAYDADSVGHYRMRASVLD